MYIHLTSPKPCLLHEPWHHTTSSRMAMERLANMCGATEVVIFKRSHSFLPESIPVSLIVGWRLRMIKKLALTYSWYCLLSIPAVTLMPERAGLWFFKEMSYYLGPVWYFKTKRPGLNDLVVTIGSFSCMSFCHCISPGLVLFLLQHPKTNECQS